MSNGRAERAVRTIKEMARTLRKQIALRCDPVHLWSFVHGTFLYNAFGIQRRERMTPMQLLGEGKYKGVLLSYGECVMALQANAGKSLRTWRKAVWLGKDPRTGSHLVGGVWGVTTSRSVRRLPSSSAWVASELDKVRGTPWLMLQKSLTVKDNFGVPPILPRVAFAVEDEAASDPESEAESQAEQQSEPVLPDNAMLADLGSVGQSVSEQSGLNRMGSVMPSVPVQKPPPPSASVAGPVIPPEDMQDVVMSESE